MHAAESRFRTHSFGHLLSGMFIEARVAKNGSPRGEAAAELAAGGVRFLVARFLGGDRAVVQRQDSMYFGSSLLVADAVKASSGWKLLAAMLLS